ncbi:MAG: sugar transferase [Candidatus Fermentibacteraceae bacterium]|nr:sugar transferase [Candidatus Fermentibacteraceae bacterium]MBN2608047.1 sugar transferase [Candidatus Fermentibacteraceae bacterium]
MPLRRSYQLNRLYFFTVLLFDLIITAAAILIAVRIRFGMFSTPEVPFSALFGAWVFLNLFQIIAMMVENLYVVRTTVNRSMNIFRTIRMIFAITVLYIVHLFLAHFPADSFICSRLTVLYMMFLWTSMSVVSRLLLIPCVFGFIGRLLRIRKIPVIIFGEEKISTGIRKTILKSSAYRRALDVSLCTDPLPADPDERFAFCLEVLERESASELMMVFQEEGFNEIARFSLLARRSGVPFVIFSPRIIELGYFDPWLTVGGHGAMAFCSREWTATSRRLWRVADILTAVAGSVLFLPVILLTVPAIALTSKGGVLYRQTRIGYRKKPFTFLKFRSMRVDVEEKQTEHRKYFKKYVNGSAASSSKDGGVFKTISHRAVTPVGRVIRKTSIDELPQILNVLRGDMSIVGPRPCIEYELEHYGREWLQQRFTVKPGLTGIWQVYGRSRLSFEKSQFLDFIYVISMTNGLNIRLILMTFPVMLFGKGGL